VTAFEPSRRPRRDPRRRRRGRLARVALVLAGAALLFAVGVAVGEALHDNPKPGGRRTDTATIVLTGVSK
jgi:hypothetical protein